MSTITDSYGTWNQLGTLEVGKDWKSFDSPVVNSQTFRITTTITNQADWDGLKIKSAAHIRFVYILDIVSPNFYIRVNSDKIIRELRPPQELIDRGIVIHYVECRWSNPRAQIVSSAMFAKWNLTLECLV